MVVAPDYAGLGVTETSSGQPVIHQFFAGSSLANDIIFAVQAAQSIFSDLSKSFIVIGHSQGGAAAWATAQRQAIRPVQGFLGAISVAPCTTLLDREGPLRTVIAAAMCPELASTNKDSQLSEMITEEGQRRLKDLETLGAGVTAGIPLLMGDNILEEEWTENKHFKSYHEAVSNGGKQIGAPLLVIHGESDDQVSIKVTARAVDKTGELFPSSQLEFFPLPGISHIPALQASQRLWMEWIADRFAGREARRGVHHSTLPPARPSGSYHKEQNWYLEAATKIFHAG